MVLQILINAALLALLLVVVGRVAADFMRVLAVILFASVASGLAALLLGSLLWGVPAFAVSVAALYFLIGWFFDLTDKQKITIVGCYLIVQVLLAFIF